MGISYVTHNVSYWADLGEASTQGTIPVTNGFIDISLKPFILSPYLPRNP